MLGRRLLVLMAVLLGLTALAAALAPRPTVVPPRGGLQSSRTPAPSSAATSSGASRVVARTLSADQGAGRRGGNVVRAREGDTVRLSVRGDVLDAVELQGLGQIEPLDPASPARFEFIADEPGDHPIVLLDADRRIGRLDIRPRAG
jgi:FtsP/CotA-like multicopper oxidase with cupredoxin domain